MHSAWIQQIMIFSAHESFLSVELLLQAILPEVLIGITFSKKITETSSGAWGDFFFQASACHDWIIFYYYITLLQSSAPVSPHCALENFGVARPKLTGLKQQVFFIFCKLIGSLWTISFGVVNYWLEATSFHLLLGCGQPVDSLFSIVNYQVSFES